MTDDHETRKQQREYFGLFIICPSVYWPGSRLPRGVQPGATRRRTTGLKVRGTTIRGGGWSSAESNGEGRFARENGLTVCKKSKYIQTCHDRLQNLGFMQDRRCADVQDEH